MRRAVLSFLAFIALAADSVSAQEIKIAQRNTAGCYDPPLTPRGRCHKANGGFCDSAAGVWRSPNEQVRKKCAGHSDKPDRKP